MLGFHCTELPRCHDAVTDPVQKSEIYRTTTTGYGNAGHDFGDALTADERRAVIEYLKTL